MSHFSYFQVYLQLSFDAAAEQPIVLISEAADNKLMLSLYKPQSRSTLLQRHPQGFKEYDDQVFVSFCIESLAPRSSFHPGSR